MQLPPVESPVKRLVGDIITTPLRTHGNFNDVLKLLEGVVLGVLLMVCKYNKSEFYGSDPRAVMDRLTTNVLERYKNSGIEEAPRIIMPGQEDMRI